VRWSESGLWCFWQPAASLGFRVEGPLYQLFLVQRPIDQHPATGPAARTLAADTLEGITGRVGRRSAGDEPPQAAAQRGKHASARG
jgi:hypothetical protein